MNADRDITVFLAVLSALSLLYNMAVLCYVLRNRPFNTELARERPFTRKSVSAVLWMSAIGTAYLMGNSAVVFLRNSYTLPVLVDEAPPYVVWATIAQHVAHYGMGVLPSFLLMVLTWGLQKTDEISEAQLLAKQEIRSRKEG